MFTIFIDLFFEKKRLSDEEISEIFNKALNQVDKKKLFVLRLQIENDPINIDNNRKAHLTFFEVSSGHPLIMFNSGYLTGKNASLKFIKENNHISKNNLPIPISHNSLFHSDIDSLLKNKIFFDELKLLLNDIIKNYFKFQNHLDTFWFQSVAFKPITIIGTPDFDPNGIGKNEPSINSRNEDIYDFGDKDTFIDACMFLSRYYPYSILERTSSDAKVEENGNLVIIGGPGSDEDLGNIYCKRYMDLICSNASYLVQDNKEFVLNFDNVLYKSIVSSDNKSLTKDYGYFASFTNPNTPTNRVILINGIHTLGVLGAFLAFSDHPNAELNYRTILEQAIKHRHQKENLLINKSIDFECFFEVTKSNNNKPFVPKIIAKNIRFFGGAENKFEFKKKTFQNKFPKNSDSLKYEISAAFNTAVLTKYDKSALNKLIALFNSKKDSLNQEALSSIWKIIKSNTSIPNINISKINTIINA